MTVTIVNQWTATFAMPSGFANTPAVGASEQVTVANTAGNWLIALIGWQNPAGYATTMAAGDDAGNWWEPLGSPAGTSGAGGLTRCSIWAAPYAMAAATVSIAPSGYCPAYSALILEVGGMSPGMTLEAVQTALGNAVTSLGPVTLPAPAQQVITLACAASDNNADTVSMSGSGWTALTTVAASNGTDHTADLTLTSGWQVTSGSVSASWSSTGSLDLSACAVALAVTQAAPAGPSQGWPSERFQAAFGAGIGTPWDQLAWTDLTPRFRGFSGTRGKQYELDAVQAASMPVTLSNNDGALTPGNTASAYYQGLSPWTGANGASLFLSRNYAWSGANSMMIAPDGVTANSGAASEHAAVSASTAYSGSAAVLCPQGWASGVQAVLSWYTSGGTLISSSTGTAVPLAAGQWAYPQVTATSPSNAAYAALNVQAAGTPPSGTLFYADFCLLTGPAGAVLNQNFNFGTGPDVYTPVRHLATWAGRTYVGWRGFMERWPMSMTPARYTVSSAIGTDIWAGLTALLPTVIDGEYLADEPWAYWPCTDAAGSTVAANKAPGGAGPLVVTESKFGAGAAGTQAFGANSGAFRGDTSGTTWQQSGLAAGTTDNSHGYCLKYQAAVMPAISEGVTIEAMSEFASGVADPSDPLIIWVMRGSAGSIAQLWASYSGSSGLGSSGIGWFLTVWDKVTKAYTTTSLFPYGIETQGWTHWSVRLTSTTWSVVIDGGAYTPATASGTCNLADNWQWISFGGSADQASVSGFSNQSLARLAIYPRVLPQSRTVAHYFAAINGLQGDQAGQRIERLLSYAPALAPRRIGPYTGETYQDASDIAGQALAQNITNIAQSDAGLLAVDRCGYLALIERFQRWNLPAQWTIGELAAVVLNRNWDFETGISPWNATGGVAIAQSSAAAFTGTYSMLVTPNAGTSAALSGFVPVVAGSTYTGTAQLMSPAGWASGGLVQVNWYSAAQSLLSTSSGTAAALNAGQWTPVLLSAAAPANAAYAQLIVSLAGAPSSSNPYYADQAQIAAAGEIPYLGDVAFDFDPSLVYDDITVNQYLGTTVTASSSTSLAQYGDQTLQETVYMTDPDLAGDLADWILGTYGTPAVRAAQFTVDAAANPYAWPFVLSADVGTVIYLSRRLGGTQTVISGLFSIQSVSPSKAPGQYQVRYSATPYFQGNVLATNDPVHGLPNGSQLLSW